MADNRLRLCRSILFLPASNKRAIEKARSLAADMVILDCEDAVKDEDKEMARGGAVAATKEGFGDKLVAIRINSAGGPYYSADVIAARDSKADFVILPKVDDVQQIKNAASLCLKPVLAMIETAAGVLHATSIAPAAAGLIAGTNDLSADLMIPIACGRTGLHHSLQTIVLAARAAHIAVFDGVYNSLDDEEGLMRQCEEGRAFGFDGKTLIHPNQIDAANRIFSPSDEEVAAAQRLIAAATGGAERFEGGMIESMHLDQAKAIVAKARR